MLLKKVTFENIITLEKVTFDRTFGKIYFWEKVTLKKVTFEKNYSWKVTFERTFGKNFWGKVTLEKLKKQLFEKDTLKKVTFEKELLLRKRNCYFKKMFLWKIIR